MPENLEDAEAQRRSRAAAEAEQAEAAAAEAGAIGGPDPMPGADPADRPVAEGGGGEAEGFEQAEDALIRQASHEDNLSDPAADAFTPELESDRSPATYGEPDDIDSTEVTSEPPEGPDGPGQSG
ncbi:MAG: hypothetical protein H0U25_02660 [Thermoleophilaceae bacterium]|nr:hypothetical protein [Thermoleophilaceae bacterium]